MRMVSLFMALAVLGVTIVVHGATRTLDFSNGAV